MIFYKKLAVLGVVASLSLTGCGGGGGGGGDTTAGGGDLGGDLGGDEGISGVSMSGVISKGIINKGNVVAEELDSNGAVLRAVGSAVTGIDGSYEINIDSTYEGGPVEITISADAATEMKCDIPVGCGTRTDDIVDDNTTINFGEWYKPGSLTMSALVAEAAQDDTISVNVTPYTDLAASRAKESGTLDATAVYSANSEVSNLLGGIDILNTKPIDITDAIAVGDSSPTEIAYAAFGAAVAALADTSQGSPDIDGALQVLSNSFAGGTIIADDGGSNDQVISLQELITHAEATFDKVGKTDTSSVLVSLQSDVDSAGTDGTVNPEPSPTAGSTALTKVKTFVGDVRTWGTVISLEAEEKFNAFDVQTSLASDAADMSVDFLVGPALEAALDAISLNVEGIQTGTELIDYLDNMGAPLFSSGTISNLDGVITIADGVIGGDVTVNMTASIPVDGTTASSFTIGITSATFRSAEVDADINKGTVVVNLTDAHTLSYVAMEDPNYTFPNTFSGASIDLDISLTQKQDATGAALAAPVTFSGTLATTLTDPKMEADEYVWITPSTLSLGGEITSGGNSMTASFTANISNGSTFTPVGYSNSSPLVLDGLVNWTVSDSGVGAGNDTFEISWDGNSVVAVWSLDNSVTVSENGFDSYTAWGYSSLAHFASSWWSWGVYVSNDAGEYYFADLSLADFSVSGSASGELLDQVYVIEGPGDNQWLQANVGLSFSLQLDELPEATVSVTGNRTGFDDGTATITLAYGTRNIVINGTITDAGTTSEAVTGDVVITNQDGVKLTIISSVDADGNQAGTIEFNGTKYADIEELTNGLVKITYTDGTFETL